MFPMDEQNNHKTSDMGNNVYCRMILNQIAGDSAFDEENVPCNTPRSSVHLPPFGGLSSKMAASTTGGSGIASVSSAEYVRDPGSILSLQPWIFRRNGSQNNEEMMFSSAGRTVGKCKNQMDGFRDGSAAVEVSPRSPRVGSGPGKNLRSRRSHRHLIKPLVSMENSFVPQLYDENFEIEEYMFGPVLSPAAARPFTVTDGTRIISKSRFKSLPVPFDIGFRKEECRAGSRTAESVVGVSPLPEPKKSKRESGELLSERLGMSGLCRTGKLSNSAGLLNRMLIFSTGVSIGILSSSLSNKKEVDALNGTLKRMENLVQDLQEELEMKEALTVKELPDENSSAREDWNSQAHLPESEPMSKIEAELEAELERLELNITSKRLEVRASDFSEVEQEFIGDVVQGELKVDMVHRDLADYSSESDNGRNSSGSSPGYMQQANYPVSPRELSLRLHKVIQHRLQDRIKELEAELAQSQKQLQLQMVESERVFSERTCSNSDPGSSSNQESPIFIQDTSSLAEPFCLNLAGDALDAYDEAYEEFMRISDSPCTTSTNGKPQRNEDYSVDHNLIWGMEDDSATNLKRVPTWEQILKSGELNRAQEGDEDEEDKFDDDGHDEDEVSKLLIQQIVERTKQGSPVLIHAQRMLFSVEE